MGTKGADQFIIRMAPTALSVIQISDNGGTSFTSEVAASVTRIAVVSVEGNDTLTIDQSNGFVGKASGLAIHFDGDGGFNTLALKGSAGLGVTETLTQGATPGTGTMTTSHATGSATLTFTSASAIDDTTTATSLTLNAGDSRNLLQVRNGPTIDGVSTMSVFGIDLQRVNMQNFNAGDPDGAAASDPFAAQLTANFERVRFANKTNVTINTGDGNDFVVLNDSTTPTGVALLMIDGGAGQDVIAVRTQPMGTTTNFSNFERTEQGAGAVFIQSLYQVRLSRPAAQSEIGFWLQVLIQQGVQAVVNGIENSQEAFTRLVQGFYVHFLGRQTSGGEEHGWVNALVHGATEEQVIGGIAGSPEFRMRANSMFTTGTADERFVRALYQLLLNRTASASEVQGWTPGTGQVQASATVFGFLNSREFRTDVVSAYYISLLHRPSDPVGLESWVASKFDLGAIRAGFLGSTEFVQNF